MMLFLNSKHKRRLRQTYKRPSKLPIPEYVNEFENRFNKVKEHLIKATNQLLRFLKKPKSLRQGLSIKYVHLSKQKEKPIIIALIRPKEEIHSIARVMLPDTPFMNL